MQLILSDVTIILKLGQGHQNWYYGIKFNGHMKIMQNSEDFTSTVSEEKSTLKFVLFFKHADQILQINTHDSFYASQKQITS